MYATNLMYKFDWSYKHGRCYIKIIINMSKYLISQSVFKRMLSKTLDLMKNLFTEGWQGRSFEFAFNWILQSFRKLWFHLY